MLDIGSADGALFQRFHGRIREGLGIDPRVTTPGEVAGARLVRGFFPQDMPDAPSAAGEPLLRVSARGLVAQESVVRVARELANSMRGQVLARALQRAAPSG